MANTGARALSSGAAGGRSATVTCTLTDSAGSPGKTEMCAKWQMGQVAAEPGASICHREAPVAISITATTAAVTVATRNQATLWGGFITIYRNTHPAIPMAVILPCYRDRVLAKSSQ